MPPFASTAYTDPLAKFLISGESPKEEPAQAMDPLATFLLEGTEEEQKAAREKQVQIQKAADENLRNRGEFARGVARGTDTLEASLYGFAGLAGSAMGMEGVKQWGFEGYKRNIEEAQENPASVQFEDLTLTEPAKAAKWAIGSLGELAPSMAEAMVTSLAGAAIGTAAAPGAGTAAGALAGFLGKRAMRKMVQEAAESYIQKGVAREAAEEIAQKEVAGIAESALVKAGMRTAGAQAGMVSGVMPMEAGGNWGEVLQEKGIDNPISALATGTAAAFLELAGGNARLIGKILGPAKETAFRKAISAGDTRLVARMGKEALTSSAGEYGQEFSQEFLSLMNTALNDPTFELYTAENLKRLNEAGWMGAVGGFAGGTLGGAKSAHDDAAAAQEKAKQYGSMADRAKLTEPILTWKKEGKTPEEIYQNVAGVIDEFNALLPEETRREVPMSAIIEMTDTVLTRDAEAGQPPKKKGILGAFGMREKAPGGAMATGGQAVTDIGKTPATPGTTPETRVPEAGAMPALQPMKPEARIPPAAPPQPMGATITGVDALGEGHEEPEEEGPRATLSQLIEPIAPAAPTVLPVPSTSPPSSTAQPSGAPSPAPEGPTTPAPLRPEPREEISAAPTPPLPGWDVDRGAMPGEPIMTYQDKGAIVERVDDQGMVLYEGLLDGGMSVGVFESVEEAGRAVEEAVGTQKPAETKEQKKSPRRQMLDDMVAKYRGEGHEINDHGVYETKEKIIIPFSKAAGRDGAIKIAEAPDGFRLGINISKKYGDYEGGGYAPSIYEETYGTQDEAIRAGIEIIRSRIKANDPKGKRALEDLESFEKTFAGSKTKIVQPGATSQRKQPWEMRQVEVTSKKAESVFPLSGKVEIENGKPIYKYSTTVKWGSGENTFEIKTKNPLNGTRQAERLHKEIVKQALSEGKPVPPEVLKDYPELQQAKTAPTQGVQTLGARPKIAAEEEKAAETKEAPAASTQVEEPSTKVENGAPYKVGDRVVVDGRHGAISEVAAFTMQPVFGGTIGKTTRYTYRVKYDSGRDWFASEEKIQRETEKPTGAVVPDVLVPKGILSSKDEYRDPEDVVDSIQRGKERIAGLKEAANRARSPVNRDKKLKQAKDEEELSALLQAEFNKWAAQNPEAAAKYRPVQKTAGTPAPASPAATGRMSDYGLQVVKTTTNKGTPVWNVFGNTKEHSQTIKRIGGRWYGPKKVWSFYDGDPTAKLLEALGGKTAPTQGVQTLGAQPRPVPAAAKPLVDPKEIEKVKTLTQILIDHGGEALGYNEWIRAMESGDPAQLKEWPDVQSTIRALGLSIDKAKRIEAARRGVPPGFVEAANAGKLTPYDTPEIIAAREKADSIPLTILIDTEERKALRQEKADKFYGTGAKNQNKRADLVIGMPGAGKSSRLAKPLAKEHGSLIIDSDDVKEDMPEYQKGIGAKALHLETAFIADDLILGKAIRNGDNVVLARLGKTLETMQELIRLLKGNGYEVHVHYMDAKPAESARRAVTRFLEGGRFVDPAYILNTVDTKPKEVYNRIKEMEEVSSYEAYDNNVPKGTDPRLYDSGVRKDAAAGGRDVRQVGRDRRQYPEEDTGREEAAKPEVTPPLFKEGQEVAFTDFRTGKQLTGKIARDYVADGTTNVGISGDDGMHHFADPATVKAVAAYGSTNKIFTKDKADKAREILRKKLGGIHMGVPLDPEIIQAGMDLAGYHIESGARSFAAYSKKMIEDLGDVIRPYLKSFYMAVRNYPGFDKTDMDNEAALDQVGEGIVTLEDKQVLMGMLQRDDMVHYKKKYDALPGAGYFREYKDGYIRVVSGGGLSTEVFPDDIIRAERDGKPIDISEKKAILEPTEGGEEDETRGQREQPRPGVARPSGLDAGESPATDVRPVPEGGTAGLPGQKGRPGHYPMGSPGEREETAELAGPGDRVSRPDLPARRPGEPGERPDAAVRQEAERDRELAEQPHGAERGRNHRIGPTDTLFQRGKVARIEANIRAIILSKKLQKENRDATPAEMRILAQYTGWGAVTEEVFKEEFVRTASRGESGWYWDTMSEKDKNAYLKWKKRIGEKLHPDLGGILTEEEWDAARESGLNAHFTSREVIEHGLWALARRLGFESGTVLEPAAGVGHILGLIPEEIYGRVRLMGVELDNVTGNMLKQLYPDAEVQVTGFEEARGLADNTVDLVISNFPFGKYEIFDKQHPDYSGWSIHNYFFARSLDVVRPGGLVVAITSHWTMDATTNGEVRKHLARKADLIGAVRLPNTAFADNAGTEVVTDILVLRKKTGELLPGAEEWRLVMPTTTEKNKEVSINEYFIRHPEMILGKNSTAGSMYGADEYTVEPDLTTPLPEQLDAAVARFPAGLIGEAAPAAVRNEEEAALADKAQKEGQLVWSENGIHRVEHGRLVKPAWAKDAKKVTQARKYLKVKEQAKRTEAVMLDPDATDEEVAAEQAALNREYDAYVKAYGPITAARRGHLADDIEFAHAMALEREVRVPKISKIAKGKRAGEEHKYWEKRYEKMDIFTKRTLYPFVEPASAATLEDALNISLTYRNHLNMDLIAKLLGEEDPERIRKEILDRKLAFENPATGLLEMPGEYLSGNVREKLRIAEEKGYAANAEALRQAQPKDLTIDEIYFRLGSQWIPADVIKGFLLHLGYDKNQIKVEFAQSVIGEDGRASWSVISNDYKDLPEWDTVRMKAFALVEDTLNLKMSAVYDLIRDEHDNERRVLNDEQTAAAQEKQRQLNAAFIDYILRTPDAARLLTDIYNNEKNNYADREWTVPTLEHYPGANVTIRLDEHQKRGVARGLQGSCIYAHAVGTGKTFLYSSLAMELRRTGQARKPLIVVQNATLNQFAAQARQLYPAARILCPTKADREQKNRQRLIAQIATGDWDFVILPHSFFDSISVRPDREKAFLQEQIDTIRELLREENEGRRKGGGRKTLKVKQLEALLKQKEARMRALLEQRQDTHMALEDMGLDALLVDEAHHYKRGEFFTQMGNIKGIDRGAAAKSFRFLMKCRVIQERTGFKNIYLATGTPVSNTTAELWTLLRYIRPDLLAAFNVSSFDAFATSFGDTSYELEPTPTGAFARVARFNKYVNGPEMLRMWKAAADVILQEEVPRWKGAVPKLRGGEIQQVVLPRSEMLAQFVMAVREAREAWEGLPGDEKRELTHIPLMLYNWAKSAAIDMRLVVAGAPDVAVSKANRCVKEIHERWAAHAVNRGTQLVFCDSFNGPAGFNLYEDIKKKLVAKGIPAGEIAIITQSKYNSDDAREALFEQVNDGTVRVVLGSSFKLGTGVNVQERLTAIHHIDAPVRPMDFEQRNGRIIRPGNSNEEVEILAYATENSLDALAYSVLQKKQKFVNQLLRGDLPGRMFDDPADELQFAFEDLAAAAMGDPLFKLRYDLEGRLRELTLLRDAHREGIGKIRSQIWMYENLTRDLRGQTDKLTRLSDEAKKAFPDEKITEIAIDGKTLDRKEGEKALKERMDAERAAVEKAVGDYLEKAKNSKEPGHVRGNKTHLQDVLTILYNLRYESAGYGDSREPALRKAQNEVNAIIREFRFQVNGRNVKMQILPDVDKKTLEDFSETLTPASQLRTVAEIGGGVGTGKRSVAGILGDLESHIEKTIHAPENNQRSIENNEKDLEANKKELDKPFPKEEELRTVQSQLSETIRALETTAAETDEGLDEQTKNRIDAWAGMMVSGARPVMGATVTHRPAMLERRVNIARPEAPKPDAAAAAEALTAPVAPDLDALRKIAAEKWDLPIEENEFEDDAEREAYAEWRSVQARAQAILSAHGEGKIEAAQRGLDQARRVWGDMDHPEGEEENYPPIFTTVQRIITAVRQGQGKLFEGDQYSAETGKKPPARVARPEIDDLVGGLTAAVKGIEARRTKEGRWVVRTKSGHAVEIVAVEQITPSEIEMAILERDWGVKYDTAATAGLRIAGAYTPETKRVRLVKDIAGAYTITHEFEHFLEDIGVITNADILVLKQKINSLHKAGKLGFKPALADRVGGPEDRAKWIARELTGVYDAKTTTGKILQKIREIIDRIVNALGVRTAGGVVRDIREGRVFERESTEGEGSTQFMVAYHGSPHTFDRFDRSKIGTGEGAQAYGYGLYFAGKKEVAEYYKNALSPLHDQQITQEDLETVMQDDEWPDSVPTRKLYEYLNAVDEDLGMTNDEWMGLTGKGLMPTWGDIADLIDGYAKKGAGEAYLRKLNERWALDTIPDFGNLYEVDLAPEEDEYLLWDKPLSEQSEKVKSILAENEELKQWSEAPAANGLNLYGTLSMKLGSDKAASDYLHSLGIRGIKYLAGSSRGAGGYRVTWANGKKSHDTLKSRLHAEMLAESYEADYGKATIKWEDPDDAHYNYVIFSDEDIAIKEMYSLEGPGTPAFRKWFGTSKVVDKNGRPLTMYHGTNRTFATFDPERIGSNFGRDLDGFFFTDDKEGGASGFAMYGPGQYWGDEPRPAGQVLPVYLKIEKPYTLEDFEKDAGMNAFDEIEAEADSLTDFFDDHRTEIVRFARRARADGIFFDYSGGFDERFAVVFRPDQIKSATGNRGTFDATNPDIRYSLEGLPEDTAGNIRQAAADVRPETSAQAAAAGAAPSAGMESAGRPQAAPRGPSGPVGRQAEEIWQAAFGTAAGATNRAVASLGARRASPEAQKGLTRLKQHWKEFWSPFSTVPQGKQALAARYKAMGDIAQAVRFLEGLHRQLDAYPPEIKKDMFLYLDGQIPVESLPEDARPLAQQIRERTGAIGLALVDRGILAEGQFNKYAGRYIHYMYARHILGDGAEIGLTGTGKLDLSYTLRRNPKLTMEQRRELGLIEDASIAVPVGMGKALTDIAKWDYLAAIAENPEWVWQPSVVKVAVGKKLKRAVRGRTRAYVKMGIGKLAEETALYADMARKHPNPEVEEHYNILRAALDQAERDTANVPADFKQLPTDKHYGDLAGAFVRAPIADDLRPILSLSSDKGKLFNAMIEIHGQGMAIFKIGKVAVNFPTAFRNIVSNIIQNNMRGRPLVKIFGDIVSALESMKAADALYEEAFQSGMFKTNWFAAEINDVLEQFRKVGTKDATWTRALLAIKNVAKYYGKIDDISKFAIYKQMRKDGADHAEALLEAMKWGMDYSLASRSIKGLRQTVTPFISYQYKIAPLIAESLAKRPWVIGKYLAVWPLMKALAMGMNDLDDDDWDDLMKQLPSYVKQTGSVMILPWKSDKGQWQWINLEYFFPWGNYLGIFRDLRDREIGELTRDAGISNPFIDVLRIAQSARGEDPPEHPYTGQPIWNRLDSAPVKAGKFVEALANIWTPAMITRQGAIGYTGQALIGGEDRWGREVTAGQALGRWFGLNITAVSPEQTAAQASVKIQDLKKELSRVQADQRYDEEEKAERENRMRERIAEIGREAPAAVLPILKAKGGDPVYEELLSMVQAGTLRSGPPARTVEIGGLPRRMTMDQYREYLGRSSDAARPRLQRLFESDGWKTMNAERKGKIVASIIANARKGARQKIKAEIARNIRAKGIASLAAPGP